MTDELKIRLAAAAAHGFINAAAFNPIHDKQAARIVNEIAEALWPGQDEYKWRERDNVEG